MISKCSRQNNDALLSPKGVYILILESGNVISLCKRE